MTDLHSAIQAVLASANLPSHVPGQKPPKPVITISRDHGAMGRQIADALAKRLDVPVYDWTILNKIAERLDADPATVKLLDESIARSRDMWLVRLFTGQDLSTHNYRAHLVNVVLSLAKVGGIVLGRGANIILSTSCALRVRVIGSPDVCARRIVDREKLPFTEAKAECERINANRGRFVWELFEKRQSDPANFDLIVNTDRFDAPEDVVGMVLEAYEAVAKAHALHCVRSEERKVPHG